MSEQRARAGQIAQHQLDAVAGQQFERAHGLAQPFPKQREQFDRGPGELIASQAVCRSRGQGTRRSTAAVITPSVPSAPMNTCFRS